MDVRHIYDTALLGAKHKVADPHTAALEAVARAAREELRERIAKHFDETHRELWSPQIVEEIRALPCDDETR